uniref:F-box protein At1g47340-like n=1 Tax=Fragaria vesca subsp. vesca TaxID=101020 RepID=UPI0005C8FF9E|nr:PREDICTED: F-box protein At1g47340-like [Fragaria vesca subsp. vesca]
MARAQRMRLNSYNMLDDLPSHILVDIFKRLPCESIYCIRCVSKALLKTVDDISFLALHTRFLTATKAVAQVPQLMSFAAPVHPRSGHGVIAELQPVKFDGGSALITRGEYAINVSTSYINHHPTFVIDFVFCNLFFFRSAPDYFLIDPLRGEVLRLPKTKDAIRGVPVFGMGFDSITNTIKILNFAYNSTTDKMRAQVLVLGKNSWREIPSSPPCYLSGSFPPKNACAYGDMHWLVNMPSSIRGKSACSIMSFDFKREEFCLTHPILQSSNEHSRSSFNLHLLTLRGSLALVDTSLSKGTTTKIEIWLMNDYEKKQWTCDYSLNIDMLDFRMELGLFTKVTCGVWEHGIFFQNFDVVPAFFLDLRCDSNSVNIMRCTSGRNTKIVSCTGGLIRLKNYQSLVDTEQGSRSTHESYFNFYPKKVIAI